MIPEASIQQAFYCPPVALDGDLTDGPLLLAQFWEQQAVFVDQAPAIFDVTAFTGGKNMPRAGMTGALQNPQFLNQGVYIEIDARDADAYVRFRAAPGTPSTTPANGLRIPCSRNNPFVKPTQVWIPGPTFGWMDIVCPSVTVAGGAQPAAPQLSTLGQAVLGGQSFAGDGNLVVFRRCSMARIRG